MKVFGWYITRELPEPVTVKEVVTETLLGTPAPVTLYQALDPSGDFPYYGLGYYPSFSPLADWHGQFFTSCEQAFAAHPQAKVDAVSGWCIGDDFVTGLKVERIKVQPKPKVDKGA